MHPAVQVDQLKFTYPGSEKTILEDVSMRVDEGEFVCILGQSGCGKSTFLRLLAGLETPTGGSISMFGETIKGAGPDRAVVFQDYRARPEAEVSRYGQGGAEGQGTRDAGGRGIVARRVR